MKMETMNMIAKQVRLVALIVSAIATTCVIGGSLSLAEHYAQAGAVNHAASSSLAGQPFNDLSCNV